MDRIVENGARDIALSPRPIEPAVAKIRAKYPGIGDDERLLRIMLPGKSVDEMLDCTRTGKGIAADSAVVDLVRSVVGARKKARVSISRGDLSFSVTTR
jgi:hypothetical protein